MGLNSPILNANAAFNARRTKQVYTLDRIMDACDWNDQAVAVGAGQGLCDKGVVEIRRRFEEQSTQVKRSQCDCKRIA